MWSTGSFVSIRYMALNDLHGMLTSATVRFDDRMQADVVKRLVLCLDDANHEVQNMAVQWSVGMLLLYHDIPQPIFIIYENIYFVVNVLLPEFASRKRKREPRTNL